MKRLNLTKPHVIVMVGLPGAGKSSFAERFAEVFNAPLISWEAFRQSTQGSALSNKQLQDLADDMLEQIMKTNQTIVYDGQLLTAVSRKSLARSIQAAGYTPLFVWVQTDIATAKFRARKHGYSADTFQAAEKKFTKPTSRDNLIVISGKHTFASQLKSVLQRLGEQRQHTRPSGRTPIGGSARR